MIRKMEIKDAYRIADICKESLGYDSDIHIVEKTINELIRDDNYYMAVYEDEENKVQAFIQAQKYTIIYDGCGWNVIDLAVDSSMQNKKIGKALLSSLEEHAKKNHFTFIRLNSRVEREKAHGFYEHLGYTCDKVQKRFIKYL